MKYPHEVQAEVLRKLTEAGENTVIGKKAGFCKIKSYDDFKASVPIVSYHDIEEDILKVKDGAQNIFWPSEIKWFADSN